MITMTLILYSFTKIKPYKNIKQLLYSGYNVYDFVRLLIISHDLNAMTNRRLDVDATNFL